jgi:hypothetical protein
LPPEWRGLALPLGERQPLPNARGITHGCVNREAEMLSSSRILVVVVTKAEFSIHMGGVLGFE